MERKERKSASRARPAAPSQAEGQLERAGLSWLVQRSRSLGPRWESLGAEGRGEVSHSSRQRREGDRGNWKTSFSFGQELLGSLATDVYNSLRMSFYHRHL